MDVHGRISLTSGVAHLALGTLVLLRGPRSPIRLPLGLLSLVCMSWNLASLAYDVSGDRHWYYVDNTISSFSAVLGLHVVVAFVGRVRASRALLLSVYAAAALTSLLAVFSTRFVHSVALVGLSALSLLPSVVLLVSHLRKYEDPTERRRTRLLLAAITIGCVLGPTEMGIPGVPPVGNLAIFVSMTLVAVGVMRLQLLGRPLTVAATVYSLLISVFTVLAAVATFRGVGATSALVIIGSVLVAVVLLIATRAVLSAQSGSEERVTRLATMGRFSTQLAHDLRNPIAAIRGAAQFLDGEPDDKALGECRAFVRLVAEQAERLQQVVEEYQRIGRVEPSPREIDLNALVSRVTQSQLIACPGGIVEDLAPGLPRCSLDPELVTTALENVLRNAFEAVPSGGRVLVRTEPTGASAVAIVVEDNGDGIDPRNAERVFDDFFTTKASGTGLGLSFVRRVMRAHGGEASIERGRRGGTIVRLRLPTH